MKEKQATSKKDLFIALGIGTLFSIVLLSVDAFEVYIEYTQSHEEYELDELVLVLFVFSLCGLWYAYRRFKEVESLKSLLNEYNQLLEEENLKKDKLLLQQMKMASLGEMLQNIAHQWRQPLSSISVSASGLQLHYEMGELDDEMLHHSLDSIVKNTQYLSKTIDSFRSYIKDKPLKKQFNLDENIHDTLELVVASLNNSYIDVELDLQTNEQINGYPNELTQVVINILNNAKDALQATTMEHKTIFVSSAFKNHQAIITVVDNAGGIDEAVMHKIFDPYFTTKHQSNGTGLGLYMAYKLITERMNGDIKVENLSYRHKGVMVMGAKFEITLPIK